MSLHREHLLQRSELVVFIILATILKLLLSYFLMYKNILKAEFLPLKGLHLKYDVSSNKDEIRVFYCNMATERRSY